MKRRFLELFKPESKLFHFQVESDEFLLWVRRVFLYGYSALASISYLLIIFKSSITDDKPWLVYAFSFFILVLGLNLIVYRTTKNLPLATDVLLAVIFAVVIIGFYVPHALLGGVVWLMPFPLYVFFQKNFRQAFRWLIGGVVVFGLLILFRVGDIIFTNAIGNYFVVFLIVSFSVLIILFFIDRRQSDLAKYQLIARYANDFIFFLDNEFTIIYASPSNEAHIGVTTQQMKGKKIFDFMNSADITKLKKRNRSSTEKIEFRFRDVRQLTETWVEGSFQDIMLQDKGKHITLLVARDISRRKKYEEEIQSAYDDSQKFQLAVQNASDHIVITDPDGIILYANDSVTRLTGFSAKEVLGTKAGKLWGDLMGKEFYERFWKTIKQEKRVFEGKIQNIRKNREKYFAQLSVSPILNQQGKIQAFVGIERDITKEVEIDKAKSEFVSLASHQLRTPLSAIGWYTEMLLDGDAGGISKKQKEFLKEIYRGNRRMVELVNSLLNVSRLELGTFIVEPEETDIILLSNNALKELKQKIQAKKLRVVKQYEARLRLNVDPKLMRIIFQNLYSNAVKYTLPKGMITISMHIQKKSQTLAGEIVNSNSFLISVQDTGIGIPESQKYRIFSKLFRADNVMAADAEGTGLGLYIVKSIFDQSGGKVWFDSKEGKGTTFYATIPLSGMKKKEGTKVLN